MKIQDFRIHNIFFEIQWPRIQEIQKRYMTAHGKSNEIVFRRKLKKRWKDHANKIESHRKWMMRKQFGDNVQWASHYVRRRAAFADFAEGSGWRGEILEYIFWYEDENKE